MTGELPWYWLGRVGHRTGTAHQQALRDRLLAGDPAAACLVLLEHEPVLTLGRKGSEENLVADRAQLAARGIELVRTDRGGDITYHGPGQLMVYPVVRVRTGVAEFLASVAGALAETAATLGVPGAEWRRDPAGLWLGSTKLAACGIHLRRRVCSHGFAFNVATPPEAWQLIVPCGLRGVGVTSIAQERERRGLGPPPAMEEIARIAAPVLVAALARAARVQPAGPDCGSAAL